MKFLLPMLLFLALPVLAAEQTTAYLVQIPTKAPANFLPPLMPIARFDTLHECQEAAKERTETDPRMKGEFYQRLGVQYRCLMQIGESI